ncbi:hypothetical protein [Confluentibacter flavum]|uniref:Uncharacterized protein n=1 Tax=Confluentibacter flavum TaxID=1909700 RepID=A0A2N3HNF8_9FLAO|nr:hypothetical protein [Confluentibacter flavum]PKQ46485.1 hypothetical protein CSW08_02855 [Confluentibacter flavum]
MAPNKFDHHINEKLNNRTLQPSTDAWNTLSKRLDNKTEKHKSKPYWWLGLAASLVGILLVTTLFYNNTNVESNPIIVNNPQPIKEVLQESVQTQDLIKNKKPIIIEQKTNDKEVLVVNNSDHPTIELKNGTVHFAEATAKELTFEEQKIQDVVVQIQLLKNNNADVTDSEIDALLLKAQKEINLNQLYTNKGLVDAKSLLQDVEADIDQSFRSKVFEALKDSFGTVKSAVANRNN